MFMSSTVSVSRAGVLSSSTIQGAMKTFLFRAHGGFYLPCRLRLNP